MGEENKNTLKPDANDTEGVIDLDPDKKGSSHDVVVSDAEAAVIKELGYDVADVPEGSLDLVKNIVQYLHDKREEDSQTLRFAQEKATDYDRVMNDPRVRQVLSTPGASPLPTGRSADNQTGVIIDPVRLSAAINSDSPEDLAKVLTEGMQDIVKDSLDTFRTGVVAPIEQQTGAMAEIAAMDSEFPGWRKDISRVRGALAAHPELNLRVAYNQHVVIPDLRKENSRLTSLVGTNKQDKKRVLSIDGESTKQTTTVTEPKEYKTQRDAILAAYEAIESGT